MGRKRKNSLMILDEKQTKLAKEALRKTEKMKCKAMQKLWLSENKTYLDFAPEVVAGLFYARLTGELTIKELADRCGFPQNLKTKDYEQLLQQHPRWAMLTRMEVNGESQSIKFNGIEVRMPLGLMTTDKALEDLVRLNLARLLTSPFENTVLQATRLAAQFGFLKPTITPGACNFVPMLEPLEGERTETKSSYRVELENPSKT